MNAALNETLQANGEITISVGRWDALHPSSHVMVRAVAPNQWIIRTAHQYRQQPGSTLPPTEQTVNDPKIMAQKLKSIISQNICKIYVVSQRGKHEYNSGDLNLYS